MIRTQIQTIQQQLNNNQTLVVVTKTITIEGMQTAYEAGARIFGENRVQELLEKYEAFRTSDVKWHLIGNLQTNKVKYIIDKVALIQSLNRISLADEIQKQACKHELVMDCLVEVNIGNEPNKHGLNVSDVPAFLTYIRVNCPNIRIRGLMAMAPFGEAEATRPYFKAMHELFVARHIAQGADFDTLSMGMSNDWQVALQEGATMIRVGSKIFQEGEV